MKFYLGDTVNSKSNKYKSRYGFVCGMIINDKGEHISYEVLYLGNGEKFFDKRIDGYYKNFELYSRKCLIIEKKGNKWSLN